MHDLHTITRLHEEWDTAGLDPEIDELLTDALDRYRDIGAQYKSYKTSSDYRQLGARVATGDLPLADAIAVHASSRDKDSALVLFDTARRAVLDELVRDLRRRGDSLVTDQLTSRAEGVFVDAEKPATTIGDVTTPDEAFAAGGKVVTAWHSLEQLATVDDALGRVYTQLCQLKIVRVRWEHPHPDLIPPRRPAGTTRAGLRPPHSVRRFADLVLSGAGHRQPVADPEPAPPGGTREVVAA